MRGAKPLARVVAVLVVVALGSSGCLFTGSLDGNGGGRLTLRYRLVSVLYFERHKQALQSADVTLKNAVLAPDKWATFDVEFADVRKLSTAPLLANIHVEVKDDGQGLRTVAVRLDNKVAQEMPELFQSYLGRDFKLSVQMPGAVIASNATSITGPTASWAMPLAQLSMRPTLDFTASYQPGVPGAQGG